MKQGSPSNKTPSPPEKKGATPSSSAQTPPVLVLPKSLTVRQLAELLGISPIETIKRLMRRGVMAGLNQAVDYETAAGLAMEMGRQTTPAKEPPTVPPIKETAAPKKAVTKKEAKALKPRPPVVTVLGHVDHGKTSLLDAIRHTNVTATEAGEITQHIGAYQVTVNGQDITFIDTPGHEAFTAMRARGARVTDIAVLVVAADDGIMPQTVEAIDHARAAEVPIIVAINKIDKPTADVERVKKQLSEHNLIVEEWGGDVIAIPVSAKTGQGIPDLLEHILIVAELAELKANPDAPASGVVIESRLDHTRGALATLLVQQGTLKIGDIVVVADTHWGKVKAMFTHDGKRVKTAGPSMPVEIMGLGEVPRPGESFRVVPTDREAREIVEKARARQQSLKAKTPTLDDVSALVRSGEAKGLNLILKADVQGSIDPIKRSLEKLETPQVKLRVIHSGTGSITESDVMLALASGAVIVGFNTRAEPRVLRLAEAEGVEIRTYQIIYRLIDDIEKTLKGMLEPTYIDVIDGHAEVRATFKVKGGIIAGCYVIDGKAVRSGVAKILRKGQVVHQAPVQSLKHFKEDVSEMPSGSECGVGVEGFSDFAIGDIIEFSHKERQ